MTATNDNTVLIAIGGNALVLDGEPGSVDRQLERAATFAESVAALVVDGWTAVVTHGNGPQVGYILRRGELVAPDAMVEGLPALPLWLAVADSQGGIGHMLAVAIDSALDARHSGIRAVAVLTHAEVDADDPAFEKQVRAEHAEALALEATGVPAVRVGESDFVLVGAQPIEAWRRWLRRSLERRAAGGESA